MDDITAAILLGASRFPRASTLSNEAFLRSKQDFEGYLCRPPPRGLGLRSGQFLDLFNSPLDAVEHLRKITEFVEQFRAEHKDIERNLIVYYVGHGYFGGRGGREYYVALESYDPEFADSGLRLASLGEGFKKRSRSFRIFYIFDCCFSGAVLDALQSPSAAAELALSALRVEGRRVASEVPRHGSALLCATGPDDVALAPAGLRRTVFSDALLETLYCGSDEYHSTLTVKDLAELIWDYIKHKHNNIPRHQVRPVVHAPDQSDGNVATHIGLFPNAASLRAGSNSKTGVADSEISAPKGDLTAPGVPEGVEQPDPRRDPSASQGAPGQARLPTSYINNTLRIPTPPDFEWPGLGGIGIMLVTVGIFLANDITPNGWSSFGAHVLRFVLGIAVGAALVDAVGREPLMWYVVGAVFSIFLIGSVFATGMPVLAGSLWGLVASAFISFALVHPSSGLR